MAEPIRALDAERMARPFLTFLLAAVGLATLFTLLTASGAVDATPLVLGSAVGVATLVALLAVRIRTAGRRHGLDIDPDTAHAIHHVQDLAAWTVAATAFASAALILVRFLPQGLDPVPLGLILGLVLVGGIALARLRGVRLVLLDDAILRVPPRGLANRYPLDTIEEIGSGTRWLKIRTAVPLGDWTLVTSDAETLARTIRAHREEE